jgi:ferric-dicitrate binding protein FerR (iron transport regulator)
MNNSRDYVNDLYFLKWIFRPDDPAEQYWKSYMESHPDEKTGIYSLKEELSFLKLKNEDLSENEKKELIKTILEKKERIRQQPVSRVLWLNLLRYAAVAVIFLVLGILLNNLFHDGTEGPVNYSELTYLAPGDKPVMLLADGREIGLGKNSTVAYQVDHTIVVDGHTFAVSRDEPDGQVYDQVFVPKGYRCKMILSDGSIVYLNAGSKLIYPSVFAGSRREVVLSGEAFFEVSKNRDARFTVQTASIAVEVSGTKFNVSAYDEDPVIETVLVEGEVSVRRNDINSPGQPILMEPDQIVSYNRQTHHFETNRVDPGFYTLWKDGMLKFEKEELSSVVRKLERFYNLTVIFKDPGKGRIKISGKLDLNANKHQVLEYLRTLTGMQINELNETYCVIN